MFITDLHTSSRAGSLLGIGHLACIDQGQKIPFVFWRQRRVAGKSAEESHSPGKLKRATGRGGEQSLKPGFQKGFAGWVQKDLQENSVQPQLGGIGRGQLTTVGHPQVPTAHPDPRGAAPKGARCRDRGEAVGVKAAQAGIQPRLCA